MQARLSTRFSYLATLICACSRFTFLGVVNCANQLENRRIVLHRVYYIYLLYARRPQFLN